MAGGSLFYPNCLVYEALMPHWDQKNAPALCAPQEEAEWGSLTHGRSVLHPSAVLDPEMMHPCFSHITEAKTNPAEQKQPVGASVIGCDN